MRFSTFDNYVGARPLQEFFLNANDVAAPDWGAGYNGPGSSSPPPSMPNGTIIRGHDNYWGTVELLYTYFNSTVAPWAPVTIKPQLLQPGRFQFVASSIANSGNQARPMGVSIAGGAAGQFGYVAVYGLLPVLSTASIATDTPLGITGAGTLGASSAGKEIENMINVLPATTTVTKTVVTVSGSPVVQCTGNNTIDGLFIGSAVSGTGIPAGSVVQSLDPDGRRFTMSAGPGTSGAASNATASGGITATFTYNDGTNYYNVAFFDRPFAQGRIT